MNADDRIKRARLEYIRAAARVRSSPSPAAWNSYHAASRHLHAAKLVSRPRPPARPPPRPPRSDRAPAHRAG